MRFTVVFFRKFICCISKGRLLPITSMDVLFGASYSFPCRKAINNQRFGLILPDIKVIIRARNTQHGDLKVLVTLKTSDCMELLEHGLTLIKTKAIFGLLGQKEIYLPLNH